MELVVLVGVERHERACGDGMCWVHSTVPSEARCRGLGLLTDVHKDT